MAKIGIDIGHGKNTYEVKRGKAVSVGGKVYEEHDFNSKVAVILEKLLKAQGHTIYMAQKPFTNEVELTPRTNYYNSLDLDLIVSIHANAASPSAKGLCAFYWGSSKEGERAAEYYAKHVKDYGYNLYSGGTYASRPNTWSDFHMLRETRAVCILSENGFMTNPDEFKLIFKSDKYIQDVAEILAKTVADYTGVKYVNTSKAKPKSKKGDGRVRIQTGGLNPDMIKDVAEFFKAKKWYAELTFNYKEGNPTALTGGLSASMQKEFEAWLNDRGWWYKVIK